jgi:hypothetical protein
VLAASSACLRGGHLGAVVLSVLAHNYDEAMPTLLRLVFPGFTSIAAPFYCSAAKVDKAGRIVADVVTKTATSSRTPRFSTARCRCATHSAGSPTGSS